jgi:hypothetical protein
MGIKNVYADVAKVNCHFLIVKVTLERGSTLLRLFALVPRSHPASCRGRAALCAWCAGQTASAEAAALLRYLEQMWITVAEVAEIVEKNKSHQPLGDDPLHLSPE